MSLYRGVVASIGTPLAWFKMDEASGNTFTNSGSVASSNGTLAVQGAGHPTYSAAGAIGHTEGTGINFTNSGQRIDSTNAAGFQITSGTMSVFYRHVTANPNWSFIFGKENAYAVWVKDTGEFMIYDWGSSTVRGSGTTMTADGLYHHLVVVFDSGVSNGTKLYYDGSLVLTTTMTVSAQNKALTIQNNPTVGNTGAVGYIDECILFSQKLSGAQVTSLYDAAVQNDIRPPVATATSLAYAPVVTATTVVSPPLATATSLAYAPTISHDNSYDVPVATSTALFLTPEVNIPKTIDAPLMTATSLAFAPDFSVGVGVAGALATATALYPTPIVYNNYASEVLVDSPAVWYRMDSSSSPTDVLGGTAPTVNGTLSTTSGAELYSDNLATTFPGSATNYLTLPNFLASTFTVTFWFKTTATGSMTLFYQGNTSGARSAYVEMVTGCVNGSADAFNDGKWHHIAIVSGIGNGTWIDGNKVDSSTQARQTTNPQTRMGRAGSSATDYYDGSIDEFFVFNTALSESRIRAHFKMNNHEYTRAVYDLDATEYLKFNGTSSSSAFQNYGSVLGRTGTAATTDWARAIGALKGSSESGLKFTASNYLPQVGTGKTFACWVNVPNTTDSFHIFDGSAGSSAELSISGGTSLFYLDGATHSNTVTISYEANKWYHVAVVQAETFKYYLYWQGVKVGEVSSGASLSSVAVTQLNRNSPTANMIVDEVTIFTSALSGAQILTLFESNIYKFTVSDMGTASGLMQVPVIDIVFDGSATVLPSPMTATALAYAPPAIEVFPLNAPLVTIDAQAFAPTLRADYLNLFYDADESQIADWIVNSSTDVFVTLVQGNPSPAWSIAQTNASGAMWKSLLVDGDVNIIQFDVKQITGQVFSVRLFADSSGNNGTSISLSGVTTSYQTVKIYIYENRNYELYYDDVLTTTGTASYTGNYFKMLGTPPANGLGATHFVVDNFTVLRTRHDKTVTVPDLVGTATSLAYAPFVSADSPLFAPVATATALTPTPSISTGATVSATLMTATNAKTYPATVIAGYAGIVVADNPSLYWRIEEALNSNSGGSATIEATVGTNGVLHGTQPVLEQGGIPGTGEFGRAVELRNAGATTNEGTITCSSTPWDTQTYIGEGFTIQGVTYPTTSYTIEFWIKPSGDDYDYILRGLGRYKANLSANLTISMNPAITLNGRTLTFGVESGTVTTTTELISLPSFDIYTSGTDWWNGIGYFTQDSDRISTTLPVSALNQWTHIVCTQEADYFAIYVNGELREIRQSNTAHGGIMSEGGGFFVGPFLLDTELFLDELAVYHRVLTDDEVAEHYNAGNPPHVVYAETGMASSLMYGITLDNSSVLTGPMTATALSYAPSVSTEVNLSATLMTATTSALDPIAVGTVILPGVMTATALTLTPDISIEVNIVAPLMTATALAYAPPIVGVRPYGAYVFNGNPVAYWRFDETSGTTAYDIVANQNGTLSGTVTQSTTSPLQFDTDDFAYAFATDGKVAVADTAALRLESGACTIGVWFNIASAPLSGSYVFMKKGLGFTIEMLTTGRIRSYIGTSMTTPNSYADGEWHYLTVTASGAVIKLYVDYELISSSNQAATVSSNGDILYFGSDGSSNYLAGDLDEIAFYNRALEQAEIEAQYRLSGYVRVQAASFVSSAKAWEPTVTTERVTSLAVENVGSATAQMFLGDFGIGQDIDSPVMTATSLALASTQAVEKGKTIAGAVGRATAKAYIPISAGVATLIQPPVATGTFALLEPTIITETPVAPSALTATAKMYAPTVAAHRDTDNAIFADVFLYLTTEDVFLGSVEVDVEL